MSSSPALNQVRFRVRTDTGAVNATPTWAAAENVSHSTPVETSFCIRFSVNNTGAAASLTTFVLRVSKNGGTYTAVTTTSGATLGAQSAPTASSDADETAIPTANFLLTAGTGTASAGVYDETGSATKTLTNGFYTELEYGLILKTAGAAVGDTFEFRLYNVTTAFTTYTQTPLVTVRETAGAEFGPDKYLGTYADYNLAGHASSALTVTDAVPAQGLVVVLYALDNNTTSHNVDENACTSMSDSAGNTYTKGREHTCGGSLQGGVTTGLWYCQLTSPLTAGATITANWANSGDRDAVAMTARSYTIAASRVVSVEASNASVNAGSGTFTLDATTANIECLRVKGIGVEGVAANLALNGTAGWTMLQSAAAGTGTTGAAIAGHSLISTGTSGATNDGSPGLVDCSSVYVAFKTVAGGPDTEDDLLANNVGSASSVTQPAVQQLHGLLANDVGSASAVTRPTQFRQLQGLAANDVGSASSVTQPAIVEIVPPVSLLANDVTSASNVSNPSLQQRQVLLANDVTSASGVTRPTQFRQIHGLNANDVGSASNVSHPAAVISRALLANDVTSASSVSHPAAIIGRGLLANDVTSASGVTSPAVHQRQALDAVNVASGSTVTSPAMAEIAPGVDGLLAEDIASGSYVSHPALVEIVLPVDALLANDVASGSYVSTPALVEIGGVVPIPPEVGGGGGKVYGRGFPRKRWEELLALLEAERQAAQERAEAFEGKKDRQRAKKAAGEALRAVARARQAADEAAEVAHLGDIARMLEAASQASALNQYLTLMDEVRQEAEAMMDDEDIETLLMLT